MGRFKVELIARAVIIQKGKILLCYSKRSGHYFLPGGHIESGEKAETALKREFKEELGTQGKILKFIGAGDHSYSDKGGYHQELNLVFLASIKAARLESKEDHLSFSFISAAEFSKTRILPISLKRGIQQWLKDKKSFWVSSV